MWILELYPQGVGMPRQALFFMQEGVALIGRSATAQLSFGEDMSISRSHGQFEVEMDPATGVNAIFLKDSGSRYGTAVDGVKMAANGKIPLNGPVHQIKFGANQGTIILRVADFRFCFSQLDRAEKEELKSLCLKLKAQLATAADVATHLVTKTLTATIKSLTAIVMGIPIISMEWVRAIPSSIPPFYRFPDESSYRPPLGPRVDLQDTSISRRSLYTHMRVILLHVADEQYAQILSICGATVIPLFQSPDNAWPQEMTHVLQQSTSAMVDASMPTELCAFFDESRGAEYPGDIGPFFASLSPTIHWLTARALATSILTASLPHILPVFPQQWNRFTATAGMSSQSQVPQSQALPPPVTPLLPTVTLTASSTAQASIQDRRSLELPPPPPPQYSLGALLQPSQVASSSGDKTTKGVAAATTAGVKRPAEPIESASSAAKDDNVFFQEPSERPRLQPEDDAAPPSSAAMMPPPSKKRKKAAAKDDWDDDDEPAAAAASRRQNPKGSVVGSLSATSAVSNNNWLAVPLRSSDVHSDLTHSHSTSVNISSGGGGSGGGSGGGGSGVPSGTVDSHKLLQERQAMVASSTSAVATDGTTVVAPPGPPQPTADDDDVGSVASSSRGRRGRGAAATPTAPTAVAPSRSSARKRPAATNADVSESADDTSIVSHQGPAETDEAPTRRSKRARGTPSGPDEGTPSVPESASKSRRGAARGGGGGSSKPVTLEAIWEEETDKAIAASSRVIDEPVAASAASSSAVVKEEPRLAPAAAVVSTTTRSNVPAKKTSIDVDDWLSADHENQPHNGSSKKEAAELLTRSFSVVVKAEAAASISATTVVAARPVVDDGGGAAVDDDAVVYVVAETIERDLLLTTRSQREETAAASGSTSASASTSTLRDVRTFRKNYVRRAAGNAVISSAHMQRVLPKETEREIQMRLELEQLARDEAAAQEMFLERMGGGLARRR